MGADDTSLNPAVQSGTDARDSEDDSASTENRISRTEKVKQARETLTATRRSIWEASSLPQPTFAMLLQLDVILEYQTKCMAASKASSGNVERKLDVLQASQALLEALLAPALTPSPIPTASAESVKRVDQALQTDSPQPEVFQPELAKLGKIIKDGNADAQRKLDVILAHVAAQREISKPPAPTRSSVPLNTNAAEWSGGQLRRSPLLQPCASFSAPLGAPSTCAATFTQGQRSSGQGITSDFTPPPLSYADATRFQPPSLLGSRGHFHPTYYPPPSTGRSNPARLISPPASTQFSAQRPARFALLHAPLDYEPELLAQRLRAADITVFYCTRYQKFDKMISSIIYLEVDCKDFAKLPPPTFWPAGTILREWRGGIPHSLRDDIHST